MPPAYIRKRKFSVVRVPRKRLECVQYCVCQKFGLRAKRQVTQRQQLGPICIHVPERAPLVGDALCDTRLSTLWCSQTPVTLVLTVTVHFGLALAVAV